MQRLGLGPDFPYGTLLVNLTGAFLIGLVLRLALCVAGMAAGRVLTR